MANSNDEKLFAAAERGEAIIVSQLASKPDFAPNCSAAGRAARRGHTPLSVACVAGHVEVVETLLEAGADPDIPANGNITPAHRACSWAHEEIAMLLIEFSADMEARDDGDRTPWDVLCQVRQAPDSDKVGRTQATEAMRVRLQTWAKWLLDPVSYNATLTALLRQPAAKHIQAVYEERMLEASESEETDLEEEDRKAQELRQARLARYAQEPPPARDDGRTDVEREDLADDLLVQPLPYRVVADPPLALRYLLRHEAVAWCVHDEDGERHWLPYCAGRRKPGEEEDSDF